MTCIHIASAKSESFSTHSLHDIQSHLVLGSLWHQSLELMLLNIIKKQICMCTLHALKYIFKMNMQLKHSLTNAVDDYYCAGYLNCHCVFLFVCFFA